MVFTYQAITANCGNHDFGPLATSRFCHHIQQNNCDFYIINLQEAYYNQIEQTLKTQLGKKYTVLKCSTMDTVTNISSLGSFVTRHGVGMANLIIYNKEKLSHQINQQQAIRRFNLQNQDSEMMGYNKGGVSTFVTLQSISNTLESIKLQMISGHLDANLPAKRAKDWQNIQKMCSINATEETTWDDLISKLSDLRVSGMDCNTRDLASLPDAPIWTLNHEEIQGLIQFPLGNLRFSSTQTYVPKENPKKQLKEARYHAQGYTLSGSLDVNEILNYQPPAFGDFDIESSLILDPDENHPRDHKIIISPTLEIEKLNDFDHVKNHIYILLKNAAPIMAEQILLLTDTPESRQTLLKIFRLFLAEKGLLFEMHDFFQKNLDFINHLKISRRAPLIIEGYKEKLFSIMPWLNDLLLENIDEQYVNYKNQILSLERYREESKIIRTLDELKHDCCEILKSYQSEKSYSVLAIFSPGTKRDNKQIAINQLMDEIKNSASVEDISAAIGAIKSDSSLFVHSSEEKTGGLLSQLIDESQHLINESLVVSFEGEQCVDNLKVWIIGKLDSYTTSPKNNPMKNAASIEKKINACHGLISKVNLCSSVQEILNAIIFYQEQNSQLFKNTSGKFSSVVNECIEMTARLLQNELQSQLKK